MERVNISDLRANLLDYLRKAGQGREFEITSNGKPLATIVPPVDKRELARSKLKQLAQRAELLDVVSPLEQPWKAQR